MAAFSLMRLPFFFAFFFFFFFFSVKW